MSQQGYDVAEICLNGHVSNDEAFTTPHRNVDYCSKCGEKTIQQCPSCKRNIRGYYRSNVIGRYYKPSYCIHCGDPFPWISKRLKSAEELADIVDEFTDEDKRLLTESLNDLVRDTPRSQVAAIRFKKIVSKTTSNIGAAFRDILIDIVAESVKKQIW